MEKRRTVRAVLMDADGDVLLFHTRDVTMPELGQWWELPGGGIEAQETVRDAIVREIAEETGFRVEPDQVGEPSWRRESTFLYRGERRYYDEVIVPVRITGKAPEISTASRTDYENEDYFGYRWWPRNEITATTEKFYPGRLPTLITPFLDGQEIDEPLERWS